MEWLSLRETCAELRIGPRAVKALIGSGLLAAIRLPKRGRIRNGALRIRFPGPKLLQSIIQADRRLELVPLLSGREVAEVLGVTPGSIRQLKRRGHLQGSRVGNLTLYSGAEVRQFLFRRERTKREGKRLYSPIIAGWLRRIIDQDEEVDVQVLDTLLRESVTLKEPIKSAFITEIWNCFDWINDLLWWARAGGDIASKPPTVQRPGRPRVDADGVNGLIQYLGSVRKSGRL